ncbi:MAG: recombinase family protein [Candidatus Gracilibacteria bacterium]
MKKAVIYCRVSTSKQKNNGDSLNGQEKACRTYCKNNSIQVVGVYKEAFTGKKKKRPVFDEAINNAKENNVEYFIVFDIDRFSREGYGVYSELKEDLYNNGIILKDSKNIIGDTNIVMKNDIVDMEQYKWNTESTSEYAEVMISTQAKIEGKKIIQRTIPREIELEQLGYQVRQANLGYINTKERTPYGKVTIQIKHPIEGEWLEEIFESRAKGYLTDEEIVDNVNTKGFISKRGNKLTVKQLQMFIKMPVYAGIISSKWTGYKPIRTAYKGLIDINIWNKANRGKITIIEIDDKEVKIEYKNKKEITINQPIIETRKNYNNSFPYTKALKCPVCSSILTGNTSTGGNGKLHHYYQCRGKGGIKHKNYTIRRDESHNQIEEIFKNIKIENEGFKLFDEISEEIYIENKEKFKENIIDYNKNLQELNKKEKSIIDSIDKVINFPILLEAKNKELEDIKSEKYKVELKKEGGETTTSLDKFRYHSKRVITHIEELALQKENPELINLAFDIVYDGRIEYENIKHHTPVFTTYPASLSQQKNPQNEDLVGNLKWQSH